MMTFDEFEAIAAEEAGLLPEYAYDELSGGVLVDYSTYLHPGRVADDLYILGTYSMGLMGKQVVLYYGSFMATMGGCSAERIRRQIRETLRHEILHHLESRGGLFFAGTLIEEDREKMIRYYMMHRRTSRIEEN